jgi:hypothetical protein
MSLTMSAGVPAGIKNSWPLAGWKPADVNAAETAAVII